LKIDDLEVPESVIGCWKDQLDKATDADLAALCKQHKDLWAGFRPGKAPAREVRHRAKVNLGTLPGLPDDFKELLVRSGLSQSLLCVLSEAAIAETAAGLCDVFGRAETAAAMLLDSRESVRKIGFSLLEKWEDLQSTDAQRLEAKKKIAYDLKPFLSHMRDLALEGEVAQASATVQIVAPTPPARSPQVRDAILRLREERTTSRKLTKDLSATTLVRDRLQQESDALKFALQSSQAQVQTLRGELTALRQSLDQQIAAGIQAQLDARLRPWLADADALRQDTASLIGRDILDRADLILDRQAQEDARYGLLTQLKAELDRTVVALTRVRLAMVESLKPLDELAPLADSLEAHRKELENRLSVASVETDKQSSVLARLRHTLAAAKSLDAISEVRTALQATESLGLLSSQETILAYRLVHEAASRVYDRYLIAPANSQCSASLSGVPMYALQSELARGRPCTLVVDGHNVLHKLPTLFRPDYEAGLPGAKARKALESRLLGLCSKYPTLSVQLWFDGPVVEERAVTSNLRVRFSGGSGSDRADRQIAGYLQHLNASSAEQLRVVVSADSEVRHQGEMAGAVVVMPLELGIIID
jgi:predicted RNA-binding protein with PIN domain